eukprot:gnl/TRDRNA2_/TRDRNA2_120771_c0_seq1.p1 gnl/TRDRNA2_/TRDRNA2_120771_c0~~gnl/TRDRNA2_/TRDRNA2_120771_c0_seq1.p1  ORF type:complete len:109 (+),score=10.89 gnl/TRDRNA2_/TRDRNA2_120771_c0_seq1:3-329(+)
MRREISLQAFLAWACISCLITAGELLAFNGMLPGAESCIFLGPGVFKNYWSCCSLTAVGTLSPMWVLLRDLRRRWRHAVQAGQSVMGTELQHLQPVPTVLTWQEFDPV